MKSLFQEFQAEDLKLRIGRVGSDSRPEWGQMNAAQALAHCSEGLEMAMGGIRPKRVLIGRILGPLVKPKVLSEGEPMRRNSPTAPELVITGERDLETERVRLSGLIDRVARGGEGVCTDHPHPFFGQMTPGEWGILMYKHLDHHLRQLGV